jgi:site-specific DNA recombinase
VRIALYARVSTDVLAARGSIASQVQTLREWASREAHDLVAEYIDDGYSGARLDRPGLDALRDSAERGLFEAVLCLTPDRLARSYPYQFLVLEELARHSVRVMFFDTPALANDPHVRLALVDLVPERAPLLEAKP